MRFQTVTALCLIFGSLCPHIRAADVEGKPNGVTRTDAATIIERVSTLVSKCVDQQKAIDVVKLVGLISETKQVWGKLDDKRRARLISDVARILVYPTRKIQIDWGDRLFSGLDPRTVMRWVIIELFAEVGDKRSLPYLQKYYTSRRQREIAQGERYGGMTARIAWAIKKLGGEVPKARAEKAQPTRAELEARKREVEKLLAKMAQEKVPNHEVCKILGRLGELGDQQAARAIVGKLQSTRVHWIVRQDALRALGMVGGNAAQEFLLKELKKPMPSGANLDDYGEVEAICRSFAAAGLGRCGDESVLAFLKQLSVDQKEYKRVREASRGAVQQLRNRLSSERKHKQAPESAVSGANRLALTAENLAEREKAAKGILASQEVLVKDLIKLASKKVSPISVDDGEPVYRRNDSKHLAIQLLGEFRVAKGVRVLLANLKYSPRSVRYRAPPSKGELYPAAESLSRIGMPSIGPLLEGLGGNAEDGKARELCAWVVKKVLGEKLAKMRLEMAIEQAKRDMLRTKEKNLRAAMPLFKTTEDKAAEKRPKKEDKDSNGTKR